MTFSTLPAFGLVVGSLIACTPALGDTAKVISHFVMAESQMGGEKLGEFSALVADPAGNGVIAVSDLGYLAHLSIGLVDDALTDVVPTAIFHLTGPDGLRMSDAGFSPEAVALLPNGLLAIVSETGPRLAVFDRMGRWQRDEALPAALLAAAGQADKNRGVEALAWSAQTGFVAALEEPATGQGRDLHALEAGTGTYPFSTGTAESIRIKGMEMWNDQLFILERSRNSQTDALYPALRVIDLDRCFPQGDCAGADLAITIPGLEDADFEGLVAMGDGTFLIVSDDKIKGGLRSVFALIRVAP